MRPLSLLFALTLVVLPAFAAASNPVPTVNQPLVPSNVVPGSGAFVLKVNGTGFVQGAVVNWNGTPLPTTFLTQARVQATVSKTSVAKPGTATITVSNPAPGGGTSNPVFLTVTSASASLSFSTSAIPVGTTPSNIVAADFTRDGKLDLAVLDLAQPNSCYHYGGVGTIQVLAGNGAGAFSSVSQTCFPDMLGTFPLPNLAVADFSGDGTPDLTATWDNQAINTLTTFIGKGDGTFTIAQNILGIDYVGMGVFGDFNRDGLLDAVNPGSDLGFGGIFVNLGSGGGLFTFSGAFGPLDLAFDVGSATGDFNNDGILDVALSHTGSGEVTILLGNGDGTFNEPTIQPVTSMVSPPSVTTGDFNGDGILDLAFADSGSTALTVLLGKGDGTFTQKTGQPDAGQTTTFITTADLNGDGKLDLVLVDSDNAVLIYLGNGDGTFQTALETTAGNGASQVAIGDFNGDGRLDLAVANSADNTVSVLLQAPGATVSTSVVKFPKQTVGTSSKARRVSLTNSGSAPLKLFSFVASGDFSETHNCKTVLPIAATCYLNVVFTPTATGLRTGSVTITDNAGNSPQVIQLSGVGD